MFPWGRFFFISKKLTGQNNIPEKHASTCFFVKWQHNNKGFCSGSLHRSMRWQDFFFKCISSLLYFGTHRAQKEDHLFGLTHIYLSDIYELIIQSSLLLPLLGRWLANKLTVLLRGCWNCLTQPLYCHTVHTKHVYDFMQCWNNVEDVGPTLYKCYVLCLLGRRTLSQTLYIYLCQFNVRPASQTLA